MEMIDVLKKLEEIAQTRPELVADAVDNVSRTNPVQVQDNTVQTEKVGGMSDVHIGAQEVIGQYADEDGNLKMPKQDVLRAMAAEKEKAAFPDSYEIETAMTMVNDKFGNDGIAKADMDTSSEQPTQEPEALEGNAFAQAVQQAKASGMKKGDKFKVGDEEHTLRDSDFEGESTRDMTTEKTEGKIPAGLKAYQDKKAGKEDKKETVKEAVQISVDSPQEAGMMMQLLKLAGVQPVDQAMISQEPEAGENPAHGEPGHSCGHDDDAMGSGEMGRMRDMMTAPAEEKAEETFANSMGDEKEEPKYQDTDTLVNFHSGGLNSQKQQVRKEYPGDNPLAVKEDTITELNLADSLRAQYEGFKEAYHKKAKMDEAPKPDFLDMDKDGDKKEPMKKAVKDKEAK
jgi:hypothetical protein